MTTPQLEEDGILREWAPLSRLLQEIPLRMRRGLFLEDVKLTCVDAVSECMVVGTSPAVVYWYDRSSHAVLQLTPEKSAHAITCVKLVSSVDIMVAAGDDNGIVTIFKVPKSSPDWLPHNKKESNDKSIERYTVGGLHGGQITTLEWSLNGQKLFSGDSMGLVIYTEIDFCMNLSKAREILNENYSVVQLSYNQKAKALIVSTVLRCTLCFYEQNSWRVIQVGQKERNSLLALGGVFYYMEGIPTAPLIYCCRPGLRLWQANMNGSVQQTILFKEALKKCKNPVGLLRNIPTKNNSNCWQNCEFGRLLCWRDGLLVSHTVDSVIVVDPIRGSVVATLNVPTRNICSLATTPCELFLICGSRDLLRIAYTPDVNDSISSIGNVATGEVVSPIPRFTPSPVTGTILNFKTPANKISTNAPESIICASEVIYGHDTTLPPVVVLHEGVTELRVDQSRFIQLNAIGEEAFDEIIYTPEVKEKSQKKKIRPKGITFGERTSQEKDCGVSAIHSNNTNHKSQVIGNILNDTPEVTELKNEIPADILPDFRSIDKIIEDVKQKEILLEASLIFPTNEGDLPRLKFPIRDSQENILSANIGFIEENVSKDEKLCNTIGPIVNERIEEIEEKIETLTNAEDTAYDFSTLIATSSLDSGMCKVKSEEIAGLTSDEDNSTVLWNSFLDSVNEGINRDIELKMREIVNEVSDYFVIKEPTSVNRMEENTDAESHSHPAEYVTSGDWIELFAPDKAVSVSATKDRIIICCPNLDVYSISPTFSATDKWQKLNYKAQQFLVSSEGSVACRIHCGIAQYSNDWDIGNSWEILCRDVQWASLNCNNIWYVTRGEIFYLPKGVNISEAILCDKPISHVIAHERMVLAITTSGQIMLLEKDQWRLVGGCGKWRQAKHLAVGPRNLAWLVDRDNNLYVTENIRVPRPLWWQVIIKNGDMLDVLSICTSEDSLYISNSLGDSILICTNSVTGYRWEFCDLDVNCLQLSAEGIFEDKGSLWILGVGNQLFCGGPFMSSSFQMVIVPLNNIVCIASAPKTLWVLSDEGRVFIRQGISDINPCGTQWWKLNLEQISKNVQFSHISCGCDVVWACDIRGNILMMVGVPYLVPSNAFAPVWVTVEGSPQANNTFTKVYVGPQSHMVWALDNAGNVYVREAIFPDFLVGTGWVHVEGVKASHLSISGEAVWALSKTGVHKRIGISESNYIGESWLFISGSLDHISASVSDCVWGIFSEGGRLVVFKDKIFPVSSQASAENDWALV